MAITINGNGTITGISVGGLPDGIVDTDMIANSAVTSAKSSGLGGVSEADHWRLNNSESYSAHQGWNWGNANIVLDNYWERVDNNFSMVGSGMTESSGVFTFPSTGIYLISYFITGRSNNASSDHISFQIELSTDSGSNWTILTTPHCNGNQPHGSLAYWHGHQQALVDIQNASTYRMRFNFEPVQALILSGNSTTCLLYTSPSPRDGLLSRMPSSA